MRIEFVGENYTANGVVRTDQNNNVWTSATNTGIARPNPFTYNSNNYSDTIIIPNSGYKITRVDFNIITEHGSEWIETGESDYCNESYPELDDFMSNIWAKLDAVLQDKTKGCAFHIAKNAWLEGIRVNITTESDSPTPPDPPVEHLVFPDGVPFGYTLHSTDGSTIGDVIDVSQLKAINGELFPSFALATDLTKFTYEEIVGQPVAFVNDSDMLIATPYNYDEGWIFDNSVYKYRCSNYQPTFSNIPTATAIGTIFHTVTLDRTFCSSNQEDSVQVKDGENYTANFTSSDGYIFKAEPYCQWGANTILGEITDSKNATITLEAIDRDLTVVAVCEKESVDPQPETGLAFVQIYNPTFSQLKEAAESLFIRLGTGDAINLEQYIISIHKLMIPVPTNAVSEPIRFWKYNTGVASKVINQTEVKLSCGTVTVPEKWHNALDYSPYTSVRIWLPFLGFFDLSINELMRDEIELTYKIDVLSGKALAEIWHEDTVIYRFVGMAKFEEPYYVEAGNDITQSYLNGAYNMADYTPYLLLDRPQNLTPTDTALHGQPTYRIVTIGDCSGYIRCSQVFASGMTATDEEKQEIESLLKTGVLVD